MQTQVFPYLLNTDYSSTEVEPDLAESAEFTSPTEYTVTLKPEGLKWANGNDLTSSDVKFIVRPPARDRRPERPVGAALQPRQRRGARRHHRRLQPEGRERPGLPADPHELPRRRSSTTRSSRPTRSPPTTRSSTANAFAGPYTITSYDFNNLISYKANPDYQGLLARGEDRDGQRQVLRRRVEPQARRAGGQHRRRVPQPLSATDIEDLRGNDNVKVVDGPGGEIRYIVFNFNTHAVRRDDARGRPGQGARRPSGDRRPHRPRRDLRAGLQGHLHAAVLLRSGGPHRRERGAQGASTATATARPTPTRPPSGSRRPASRRRSQLEPAVRRRPLRPVVGRRVRASSRSKLEASGLFTVEPAVDRVGPVLQGPRRRRVPGLPAGLVPRLLGRRQLPDAVLPHGELPREPLRQPRGERPDPRAGRHAGPRSARRRSSSEIQDKVAADLSTVPYLQGAQVAVVGTDVEGAEDTLDASFKFRYGALSKG